MRRLKNGLPKDDCEPLVMSDNAPLTLNTLVTRSATRHLTWSRA